MDLMRYAELETAFRHFKEFGNTIVLLNMFENGMVRGALRIPLTNT